MIVFRDIFSRHFESNADILDKISVILKSNNSIHPDAYLAHSLHNEGKLNRYIAVSLTCCIHSSHYLNYYSFDFRGSNNKVDSKWESPDPVYDVKIKSDNVDEQLAIFRENKIVDHCQHCNKNVVDDMCHYLRYYENQQRLNNGQFNFAFNEFNDNPLEKLKKLIPKNLRHANCEFFNM